MWCDCGLGWLGGSDWLDGGLLYDLCGTGGWFLYGGGGLWRWWASELWEWGSDLFSIWDLDVEVWENIVRVADVGGDQVVEDVLDGVGVDGEGQLGFDVGFEEGTSCCVVGEGQLMCVLV